MRVLHVTDHLGRGGGETMLAGLVAELDRSRLADNVVCTATAAGADARLVEQARAHAQRLVAIGHRGLADPRIARAIARIVRAERIAVVHSHPGVAHLHARLAARATGRPHITTLHTMPGPAIEDCRTRVAADAASARLSRRIVAPTGEVARAYRRSARLPAARVVVIPNAPQRRIPAPGFDRAAWRRRLAGATDVPIVLCVARLQPAKGVGDLVAAIPELRERVGDVRVVVAGAGPEAQRLRDAAARLGAGDQLVLLGHRDDIGELLASADAFCLPSHHEGQPLSLIEAMHAGLPCVATAVGGVPSLLRDGAGLLCAPHAPGELADQLAAVLRDERLSRRLRERGGRRAADHSPHDAARAYSELYAAVARDGPRPA